MQVGTATSADLAHFGRMDAAFLILANQHRAVVDELTENFTLEELVEMAHNLPYDASAAQCVHPGNWNLRGQSDFFTYLDRLTKSNCQPLTLQRRKAGVAVYLGAAMQFAHSKVLQEVLELKKQEKLVLEKLKTVVTRVKNKNLTATVAAIKRTVKEG